MRRPGQQGFTTIELLVVVTCLGIVMASSFGSIQGLIRSNRLTGASNQLVTHMRLAREKAVSEGNDYIMTFRVPNNDYQVWDDEGSDGVLGSQDSRRTYPMPAGTNLQAAVFFGANRVIFHPDGTSNASGSVRVTNGEFSRQVSVLASTGKVTVTSDD